MGGWTGSGAFWQRWLGQTQAADTWRQSPGCPTIIWVGNCKLHQPQPHTAPLGNPGSALDCFFSPSRNLSLQTFYVLTYFMFSLTLMRQLCGLNLTSLAAGDFDSLSCRLLARCDRRGGLADLAQRPLSLPKHINLLQIDLQTCFQNTRRLEWLYSCFFVFIYGLP